MIAIVGPHLRAMATRPPRPSPARAALRAAWLGFLAPLLGLRADRMDDYPARWWLALPPLAVLAWLLAQFLAIVTSDWAVWLTPALLLVLVRLYVAWLHERLHRTLFRQFPDALSMIVRAVRVGIPVSEAIHTVARDAQLPTAREFRRIADRLTLGMPLGEALSETAGRNGVPEYRFFATALSLQAQTGGGLGETLENLADVIRKRVALEARAAALSSEAKASGVILGALPFVTGAALLITSPDYLLTLIREPQGRQILAAAGILLLSGLLVMRFMIRRALRT